MLKASLAAAALLVAAAPSSPPHRYEFSSREMGTEARVVLYAGTEQAARDASSRAFARIAALDAVMSDYRDDSEVAALCRRAASGPVAVSDDLFRVLTAAQAVARTSGGAFDVTAGPLTHLWRRARRLGELPDRDALRDALALTGTGKLVVGDHTAELRVPGMRIDLGGIGKGFAAEEAVATLKQDGIRDALVALGGDIVALGAPPDGEGWTIAISGMRDALPASVLVRDAAISTSGDAEQWLEIGGVRYSHILDPRTGMAMTGRRSATVIAPRGELADALATAVTVMGVEDGMRLVERTPGCAVTMSVADGREVRNVTSRGWPRADRSGRGGTRPPTLRPAAPAVRDRPNS